MAFFTEPPPQRRVALDVVPGVRRIVANNPGPLTYHGTNTYLVDDDHELVVIDPGPDDDPDHVTALIEHGENRIAKIIVTHGHRDHLGCARTLASATGATIYGYRPSVCAGFVPDVALDDDDVIGGMTVVHTPGHASDHICLARDGVLFTGDHVMAWSSSFVATPAGDMKDYFSSLNKLLNRDERLYLAAHGPPLHEPALHVQQLLAGRLKRETELLQFLEQRGPATTEVLLAVLYPRAVEPRIKRAAERTLQAHLLKLRADGMAKNDGDQWSST
ncbi:hypothetical protein A9R05_40995 (plasmid) [Burkholderia sp. KK1]|nr:hypothetical protein A9R05_40995 [Burkholderia sp. KK1]